MLEEAKKKGFAATKVEVGVKHAATTGAGMH
jgi:hypothetical protein